MELKPAHLPKDTLAFMFESTYLLNVTSFAQQHNIDEHYHECWEPLQSHFKP